MQKVQEVRSSPIIVRNCSITCLDGLAENDMPKDYFMGFTESETETRSKVSFKQRHFINVIIYKTIGRIDGAVQNENLTHITKTRLCKYVENFTSKKPKKFR